ncbi:hypothetical protein V4890_24095 [Ralstonia solanacearum species complex bacterium KE056]|uniref:hypothetical protein n=1 Tax=Ralstonia solanacearum species complex bacterium KE056 TaxID=3119585 RepID=UPI002FC33973
MEGLPQEAVEAQQAARSNQFLTEIRVFGQKIVDKLKPISPETLQLEGKIIFCSSLDDSILENIASPFVALLPAYDGNERTKVKSLVPLLLKRKCEQLCCVGLESEVLHDEIDDMLEELGMTDVVTTHHLDVTDACDYFIFAAGAFSTSLMAMVADHLDVVSALKIAIADE